jgi:hypothetical protein
MNYKDKSSGDVVTAWQWDGKDEVSLKQMLFGLLSYTIQDGNVMVPTGDGWTGHLLMIPPGTFILNGPAPKQLRTLDPKTFARQYEEVA